MVLVFDEVVDKIDVEILWTLKQSNSNPMGIEEIVKKNKTLSKNDKVLDEKIQSMCKDGVIETSNRKDLYKLTKKGSDLIWKGETWKPIFNLIKLVDPERYTSNEIRRITNKSLIECVTDIEFLRKEIKLIEGKSKGFKLHFILSEKGRSYNETNS